MLIPHFVGAPHVSRCVSGLRYVHCDYEVSQGVAGGSRSSFSGVPRAEAPFSGMASLLMNLRNQIYY